MIRYGVCHLVGKNVIQVMPENTSIPQGTKILIEPLLRRLSHHLLHRLLHLIDVHAMGLKLHMHKADVDVLTSSLVGASIVTHLG